MTSDILKRRKLPGLKPRKEDPLPEEPKISCVLMMTREQAADLADLLTKARTSSIEPHRFDHTSLGKILQALVSGGRVG